MDFFTTDTTLFKCSYTTCVKSLSFNISLRCHHLTLYKRGAHLFYTGYMTGYSTVLFKQ